MTAREVKDFDGHRYPCEPLVREQLDRPIVGDAVIVGKQTIYFSPDEIISCLRATELILPRIFAR